MLEESSENKQEKVLEAAQLPNNINGRRKDFTCELCGFEPKTKNKYQEKQDHLVMKHFKEKIDKVFLHCLPYACPTEDCGFIGKDKQALLRHYTGKHGILEKYMREALQAKDLPYEKDNSGSIRKDSTNSDHDSNVTSKAKKQIIQTTGISCNRQNENGNLVITQEELYKEVEGFVASYDPVTSAGSASQLADSIPSSAAHTDDKP